MDIKDFAKAINTKRGELDDWRQGRMPVIAGRIVKDHFQNNFSEVYLLTRRLQKRTPSKRPSDGGVSAQSHYGALLSSRNRLFNSVKYIPRNSSVTISTSVPYVDIHNNGWEKTATVTPSCDLLRFYYFCNISHTYSAFLSTQISVVKTSGEGEPAGFLSRLF